MGLATQASTAAADTLSWASGTTVPAPADAGSQPNIVVTSIACPSAGNCSAIGSYTDSSGETQGLLATESAGHWNATSTAQLPTNPDVVNPNVSLTSISCATTANCTAVGSYLDVHGLTQGLLLTETSGHWGTGREVIHPLGVSVSGNPQVDLTSVSCATASNCLAVGSYSDSNGHPEGLLETEINGTWSYTVTNGQRSYTGAEATLPSDAASEPMVVLSSASCGAVGQCVAVGSYRNSSNEQEGLVLTGTVSGGAWTFTPTAAGLPSGAAASPVASLNSVSCPGAGSCDAVGSYEDSSHHEQGLLLTQAGSAWAQGAKASLPADASSNPNVSLTSVSCISAGNCSAVGDYHTAAGSLHGLMLTSTAGTWGTGVEPSIPADAGSTSFVTLTAVSCYAAAECAATGNYADDSFSSHPLLLTEQTGGAWSAGVEPALPYADPAPGANIEDVSCGSGGGCTAVADYTDLAGNQLAGAVNGTLAAAAEPILSLGALPAIWEAGDALPAGDVSAVLAGGSAESGQLTFSVFGPQPSPPLSCAFGGTQIGASTVSGNGSYGPAQGFTPVTAGDYWWYANYGGDLANAPAASACGAPVNETTVQTPSVTVNVPSATTPNTAIPASAIGVVLSGAENDAGGTVTFTVYGPEAAAPSDCSAGGSVVGSAAVHGNGSLNPAGGFTPGQVGDYWWYASYSGDSSDPAATSACGAGMAETVVKASPTLYLTTPASTATVGKAMSAPISANLGGGVNETGTVTFSVFGPQASAPTSCGAPTIKVGSVAVGADGAYAAATAFTPAAAGTYWWYATYSGDAANNAAASVCGTQMPETVVSKPPTKTKAKSAPASAAVARIVAVATSGKALKVTLRCKASSHQSCQVQLKATTTEVSSARARKRKAAGHARPAAARVVTIATGTFAVGAGKRRQVLLRLNRTGGALLASRGKLSAVLELHQRRTILSRSVTMHLNRRA